MAQSIDFYHKGLGFPRLEPYEEKIAFFTLKGTWLALYEKKARQLSLKSHRCRWLKWLPNQFPWQNESLFLPFFKGNLSC